MALDGITLTANKNYLSPVGFRFLLARAPTIEYFCQAAAIPGVTKTAAQQHTVHSMVPWPGDKLNWEPFNLTFSVDEDLTNYLEIFNWMVGMTHPADFAQSKELYESDEGIFSDGSLMVLTSNNNGNFRVLFENLFPISLSTIQFDTRDPTIEHLFADVTFQYRQFRIEQVILPDC